MGRNKMNHIYHFGQKIKTITNSTTNSPRKTMAKQRDEKKKQQSAAITIMRAHEIEESTS